MMHRAAHVLVHEHKGIFPRTAEALRKLPGIGEYTSSAIASIAFGEPVAVVDGNVERVLLRVFSEQDSLLPHAKWFRDRAANLLDTQRPGDFNQAMMELGATVCLPQRPLCLHCPVQPFCKTRGEHQAPPPKKMHNRQIAYALLRRDRPGGITQVLLHQRPSSAPLMPGMWELPEIEMLESDHQRVEVTLRHAITVTNYRVHVLRLSEQEAELRWPPQKNPKKWTKSSELATLPLTGLTRKVLQRLQIMPKGVR
jgi:A/G-specific adenine glycosylase